jgi:hypothetical protein
VTLEALLAMSLLVSAGLGSWRVGVQALRQVQREAEIAMAVQWLDNTAESQRLWPGLHQAWPRLALNATGAHAHACEAQACTLDEWQLAEAQWWLALLRLQVPTATPQWAFHHTLEWQVQSTPMALPLVKWELQWPNTPNPSLVLWTAP